MLSVELIKVTTLHDDDKVVKTMFLYLSLNPAFLLNQFNLYW